MAFRFCNTCCDDKVLTMFTKYGNKCSDCKKKRVEKGREMFYINRTKCVCGLYISDGNPKEKHEMKNSHQNFIKHGTRNPDGLKYICRNGTDDQKFKVVCLLRNKK